MPRSEDGVPCNAADASWWRMTRFVNGALIVFLAFVVTAPALALLMGPGPGSPLTTTAPVTLTGKPLVPPGTDQREAPAPPEPPSSLPAIVEGSDAVTPEAGPHDCPRAPPLAECAGADDEGDRNGRDDDSKQNRKHGRGHGDEGREREASWRDRYDDDEDGEDDSRKDREDKRDDDDGRRGRDRDARDGKDEGKGDGKGGRRGKD